MRLYNTLSRQLEELPPPEAGPVRMYFCGPTVYQRAHIGNARPFLLGMWLRDWLRHRGYDAKLVHNITDVNDKIYDAAPGASAELAARATGWYIEDIGDFEIGLPDALPKATEHIPGIISFIEQLIARGNAYAVDEPPNKIVGCGPFCVKEFKPGKFTLLERNPEYWVADKSGRLRGQLVSRER